MLVDNELKIYTDGSSYPSPRRGGMGVRFILANNSGEEQIQHFEITGHKGATNNQMELQACIVALTKSLKLQELNEVSRIVIHTDSMYIVENYKNAMWTWPKTKWCNYSGKPILNADQWKKLVKCIKKTQKFVEFKWVKGHSKDEHNRAVDSSAKKSAKGVLNKPLKNVDVRRKLTSESVEIQSVKMRGQRISVRIITAEYLNVQRIHRYRYEVISKKSEFCKKVDFICSHEFLKAGHSYHVRLNNDIKNPTIMKVFREVKTPTTKKRTS